MEKSIVITLFHYTKTTQGYRRSVMKQVRLRYHHQ
jgi:hypothetical protein